MTREATCDPRRLLSPRQFAQAIGVSESSLKRWIDSGDLAAVRTNGGHRRISLPEALRFIRSGHYRILDPGPLGLAALSQDPAPLVDRLFTALTWADAHTTRALLVAALAEGQTIRALGDGPLRQVMERIGALWRHQEDGIAIEHMATATCLEAVHGLRDFLPEPGPEAAVALGGAPTGDPYQLPSCLLAASLLEVGYRTINLGPDTPLQALIQAVSRHQPRVAWLSFSTTAAVAAVNEGWDQLIAALTEHDTLLVMGGRASGALSLPSSPLVHVAGSLDEAVGLASSLLT
jgi:excisionase family DNA binding protein